MADDDKNDELDPTDWFAKQFESDPATPGAPKAAEPFSWELTPAAAAEPAAPAEQPARAPSRLRRPSRRRPSRSPPAEPPPLVEPPAAPTPASPPAHDPLDQPTQAMDADEFGAQLDAFQPPTEPPPVDSSLQGATEVLAAHELGTPGPEAEGLAHNPLDALFGETQFREYEGEPLIGAPAARQTAVIEDGAAPPRPPGIPRNQKILMWVAGALARRARPRRAVPRRHEDRRITWPVAGRHTVGDADRRAHPGGRARHSHRSRRPR